MMMNNIYAQRMGMQPGMMPRPMGGPGYPQAPGAAMGAPLPQVGAPQPPTPGAAPGMMMPRPMVPGGIQQAQPIMAGQYPMQPPQQAPMQPVNNAFAQRRF
jgi:hypothetical protein